MSIPFFFAINNQTSTSHKCTDNIPAISACPPVEIEVSGAGDGVAEASLVHGAVQRVVLLELVAPVLVDDEDAAGLELAHLPLLEVGPHRGADDEVVEAVAVQVAGCDRVAEVGADLVLPSWSRTLSLA